LGALPATHYRSGSPGDRSPDGEPGQMADERLVTEASVEDQPWPEAETAAKFCRLSMV
jgi:hypothetical protein